MAFLLVETGWKLCKLDLIFERGVVGLGRTILSDRIDKRYPVDVLGNLDHIFRICIIHSHVQKDAHEIYCSFGEALRFRGCWSACVHVLVTPNFDGSTPL